MDGGCLLTTSPINVGGIGGTAKISDSEVQTDGVSMPLVVESGGVATVAKTVFRSTAGNITVASVADGGSLTVGASQLVGADGSSRLFPCDGTLPDCAGEHDGSVVMQGPSTINMAAPLVCAEGGSCASGYVDMSSCLADMAQGRRAASYICSEILSDWAWFQSGSEDRLEVHGKEGQQKLEVQADFGVAGALVLGDLRVAGGSSGGSQISVEAGGELSLQDIVAMDANVTYMLGSCNSAVAHWADRA